LQPYPNEVPIYWWYKQDAHLFGIDPNEGYSHGYVLVHAPSFYLFDTAPSYKFVQIFRCWRHNSINQRFMTTSPTCDGESNVTREDLDGVYAVRPAYAYQFPGLVPLYHLKYPGNGADLVTTSAYQKDDIQGSGWQYLGILGYVAP
jgi:hypothetical protein